MLMSSSKLFLFSNKAHLNSGARLLVELYCVIVIKHVAYFITYAKLLVTMAFKFTFLDVIVVSDLKKNIGGSTDLEKKRHGSTDLHTPIHTPALNRAKLDAILKREMSAESHGQSSNFDNKYFPDSKKCSGVLPL